MTSRFLEQSLEYSDFVKEIFIKRKYKKNGQLFYQYTGCTGKAAVLFAEGYKNAFLFRLIFS